MLKGSANYEGYLEREGVCFPKATALSKSTMIPSLREKRPTQFGGTSWLAAQPPPLVPEADVYRRICGAMDR